jgi:hypothetical protein
VFSVNISANPDDPPVWNRDWLYNQEIKLPISTVKESAKYQPIDIQIEFNNPCWAKNETINSIRILCWQANKWHELESQVYDLEKSDSNYIKKCRIVFLVPSFANGEERYFVYYDSKEKEIANYPDHLSIEDSYYYFEPISGISAEADYYEIKQDGDCIYGVGQKGVVLDRYLSNAIVKLKPGTKEFDIPDSDNLATFCFSYHKGYKDEDELSSDQRLVSKEIFTDGNLMVSFGIVSESSDKTLRTTGIYTYYYCPTADKRICAHIKHQVFEEGIVQGITNVDGRYGAIFSFHSKSPRIQKMRFGEILPYLHIYGEKDKIREYQMNIDPEDPNREWIISYKDDCDLGKDAWFSYDQGETGKAQGILFSSNKKIVKYGTDERDGIQIKVAERELLDVLGAEIDYAIINFGRNSYEPGSKHDLDISKDLEVEYYSEFFTSEEGGYKAIEEEGKYFRELVKYRQDGEKTIQGDENIHTLTVIPRLTGRILSNPILSNITGISISKLIGELYDGEELVSTGIISKPLIGAPRFKFTKLKTGDYIIKIFRKFGNNERKIIGLETVSIDSDKKVDIYCTWQKNLKIKTVDQHYNKIQDIELKLYKDEIEIYNNITTLEQDTNFKVPLKLGTPYLLRAFYKGFKVYEEDISPLSTEILVSVNLYDFTVKIQDGLGFSPGVNVRPRITSSEMVSKNEIYPNFIGNGKYQFNKIPESKYELFISYAGFEDTKIVHIPQDCDNVDIEFTAEFDLSFEIFDSTGNKLNNNDIKIDIFRNNKQIFNSILPSEIVTIPPGIYRVKIYTDGEFIGEKEFKINADKNENIVTEIESKIPALVIGLSIIFIIEILVVFIIKKISLNTFLKLLAMALILISIFLPWWSLWASSSDPISEKTSNLYIYPQTIIETVEYEGETYREIATIPDLFSDFLSILFTIIISGLLLISFSFIPNLFYKKRFYKILISASILFVFLVGFAFYLGLSKVTEFSLGSFSDTGVIRVNIPPDSNVLMNAEWGLGVGFYLFIIASTILVSTGFIDYIRKKDLLRFFRKFF